MQLKWCHWSQPSQAIARCLAVHGLEHIPHGYLTGPGLGWRSPERSNIMFSQVFLCLKFVGGVWELNNLKFFLETAGYDWRTLNLSWLMLGRTGRGGEVKSKVSPFCLSKLVMVRWILKNRKRIMKNVLRIYEE